MSPIDTQTRVARMAEARLEADRRTFGPSIGEAENLRDALAAWRLVCDVMATESLRAQARRHASIVHAFLTGEAAS